MKIRIAKYLSIVGHPLLTFPVFILIALFTFEEVNKALFHSTILLVGIFIPLALIMYYKTKNKSYTNFDVSDKKERQSWYVYVLILLSIVTLLLFATKQPRTLSMSVLLTLILLVTSQVVNNFIKTSLHVSINVFLSFLIYPLNHSVALFFMVFTILIAWSRLTLKRHSLAEIISGFVIGLLIGSLSLLVL
jgi:membrane-associated phospholipid phosphatase